MKFSYKITFMAGILMASLLPVSQAAEAPFKFSANVALTSDYVFRGITQTDEGIAIQGGFDANHASGFYFGTWGSNVKFLENNTIAPEDRADVEIDLYVGFSGGLDNGLSYDVKAGQYMYPGADSNLNYDLTEFNFTLSYSMPQGTAFNFQYDFSPDFGGADNAHHFIIGVNHTLPSGLGFGGFVGQQNIKDNEAAGKDDYLYYGASVSFPLAGFDTSLTYTNTDLDNAEELGSDGRVFFTLSKSF